MTRFDAGAIVSGGVSTPVSFWDSRHGPVIGYGTANGTRVALALDRTTRGRELKAALDVYDLSTGRLRSPQQFVHDLSRFEMSFNGFYVDSQHIAFVSSGRLPIRAGGVDPGFPTIGNGDYDWTRFLAPVAHPHAVDPPGGAIVNWNNKPAPGFDAADDNFSYGPVHRVQLLVHGLKAGRNTVVDLVRTMNRAATQDLRAVEVWPAVAGELQAGSAPSARDRQLADLVTAWAKSGGSRLDRDGDGKIDDPGAAILDAAWPGIADASVLPTLGVSLTDRLAQLVGRDDAPGPSGSAYIDGWYGYVLKLLFCKGDPSCPARLWSAIDAAGDRLQAAQGSDPQAWRADATGERIAFAPGFLSTTMRWANRPTYQQILEFGGHR
jgi:acyl-homoserine lactone acylase PvdQ